MLILFSYLSLAFISTYWFIPKNKTDLWKYTILIPTIASILYIFYSYSLTFDENTRSIPYFLGKKIRSCIIPAIMCGIIIYFQLREKLDNEGKVKFPKILFVVTIIVFGLWLYQDYQQSEFEKNIAIKKPLSEEQKTALSWVQYRVIKTQENLPMQISENLYLNNIDFDENENSIYYTYKSLETDISKPEILQKDIKYWKDIFIRTSQKDINKDAYIEANTTFHYNIIDKNENSVVKFIIIPDEYKE